MKMSFTELSALFNRLFEGLGFYIGDYEDAAKMALWLQAHGLLTSGELEKTISNLNDKTYYRLSIDDRSNNKVTVNARGGSILTCGSQAVDMVYCSATKNELGLVELKNCFHRKFIIERLVNCSRRGMNCFAYWRNGNNLEIEHGVVIAAGEKYPKYTQRVINNFDVVDGHTLYLGCSRNYSVLENYLLNVLHASPTELYQITSEYIESLYNANIEEGVTVDSELISCAVEAAKSVLVESTEKSRAGAGD